jgi:hypothetical protein
MIYRIQREPLAWEPLAAIACFVTAVLALAIGFVLTTRWVFDEHLHPLLHAIGIVLLIIGIPLFILGGHCLDLQEKKHGTSETLAEAEKKSSHLLLALFGLVFVLCIHTSSVQAQQTIFNVPTTDVLDKGKVYTELDVSLKPTEGSAAHKFSSFVPRVVVGAGSRVEIGLNLAGNIQPGADSTTLVPTIKWKPFQDEAQGWAVVVGNNVFIPVRNRAYNAGSYVYTEMSKTFSGGTRITFGAYDFTRDVVAPANRAGGQFGFEQPLDKNVSFAADWFTGKHAAGYFTPGIIFKPAARVTGYAGYSIGNQNVSGGNHFFLLELGYNFN